MRLCIRVKYKFYYDVGIKPNKNNVDTMEWCYRFGERCPKYLEDFIKRYKKSNIHILDYGDLLPIKDKIDRMLE